MGFAVWLCALCLQASLLAHALDCSGASRAALCVGGRAARQQNDEHRQQRALRSQEELVPLRRRRQLERRGPAHPSQAGLPGSVSVKGFPNTLIQSDRSRRHLIQAAHKKKAKRKSRVGSFSLLSNNKSTPLQVIRARRQVKNEPSRRDKSGAFSVLGDPQSAGQKTRARRSRQNTDAAQ